MTTVFAFPAETRILRCLSASLMSMPRLPATSSRVQGRLLSNAGCLQIQPGNRQYRIVVLSLADDIHLSRENTPEGKHLLRRKRKCEVLDGRAADGVQLNPFRSDMSCQGGDHHQFGGNARDSSKQKNLQPDRFGKLFRKLGKTLDHRFERNVSMRAIHMMEQMLSARIQ